MVERPTGTVTFLFTDVEASTSLWEQHPEEMKGALARHDRILRRAIDDHSGYVFSTAGDSFAASFQRARDAAAAALRAQRQLAVSDWGEVVIRVRMALHAGEADEREGDYFGPVLNRAARLLGVGYGGQILLSQSAAELLGDGLDATVIDLGEHRLKDLSDPEQVFQLSEGSDRFPALRSLDALPNNLPPQLTSFVGREDELKEIVELTREHRLVTLTGVGGSGKSRLALQAAGEVIDRFRDGAWLIELASVADPALVPQTVIEGLRASVQGSGSALESLERFLAQRELLLVLDNCEHLLDAAAELVDRVLRSAPGVQILATSREGLAIPGERLWRIPSMQIASEEEDELREGNRSEAIRLFVERATQAQPEFVLTSDNVPQVVSICRRLDGMPLAIELAAARTRVLPIDEIAVRLNDRFRLLTGSSRTAAPRQLTLLATVEWSYELLSERERQVFDRLAAFRGGFTVQAAEAVCGSDGIDDVEVLDLLTQLVDKSLVVAEGSASGTDRFRMLETIRQFSLERLGHRPDADQVRRRHGAYFLSLAEQAEPLLETAEMATWLDRLETEHDNFRAALSWMIDADETIDALRMTIALSGWFWYLHRHHEEALAWYEKTVTAGNANADLVAIADAKASTHAARVGWFDLGTELAHKVLSSGGSVENGRVEIMAQWSLGYSASGTYDLEAALEHFVAALRAAEETEDAIWISRTANFIGLTYDAQGSADEAAEHVDRAVAVARHVNWPYGIGDAALIGSIVAIGTGDYDKASELASEALAVSKSLGDFYDIPTEYELLAQAARLQGQPERGRAFAREGLELVSRRMDPTALAALQIEVAANALAMGRRDEAAVATQTALSSLSGSPFLYTKGRALSRAAAILMSYDDLKHAITAFAAAESLYQKSIDPEQWARTERETHITEARQRTSAESFTAAWKTGEELDPDDALENCAAWLNEATDPQLSGQTEPRQSRQNN